MRRPAGAATARVAPAADVASSPRCGSPLHDSTRVPSKNSPNILYKRSYTAGAEGVRDGGTSSKNSTNILYKRSASHDSTLKTSMSIVHLQRATEPGRWTARDWYESNMAMSCRRFIRGRFFSFLTLICLFNALFLYDAFIVLQVPSNTELDIVLTAVFAVFLYEFVGLVLTDSTYPLGFFFWMDLIGTLSMLFDISYMLGSDATVPETVRDSSASDNVILVRAARAAKLGARAGRLSRVLKILRFMPFLYVRQTDQRKVKMATVITNQLNTVLAQRVAFLTISIVVMMPVFNLFAYPERDYSFTTWAELLAKNVKEVMESSGSPDGQAVIARLLSELQRFSDFYGEKQYGPYRVCYGQVLPGTDVFDCQPLQLAGQVLALPMDSSFQHPKRQASVREVSSDSFQAFYDMSLVEAQEATANMASLVLVITVMLGFGLLMSNSIAVVALTPLERMLGVVRGHCKQIFRFAAGIQNDTPDDDDDDEDNEFLLLEEVFKKLAAIASLSTLNHEPQVNSNMKEEDVIKLNWMQGTTSAVPPQHGGASALVGPRPRNSMTMLAVGTMASADNNPTDADERSPSRSPNRCSRTQSKDGNFMMDCIPPDVLVSLDSPDCDVLEWGKELKLGACGFIIMYKGFSSWWVGENVDGEKLRKFLGVLEKAYEPNHFHSFSHGVDVLYSVSRYMHLIDAGNFVSEVSEYLLLVAAVAHDVGHLGLNNQFLMESSHELALKYNDSSPMEMMHCSKLFHIVKNQECNIFCNFDKDLYKEVRKGIIAAILHTDMIKHNDMVKELGLLYQMNSDTFDKLSPGSVVNESQQNVQTTLNALLHCADISNAMKPWELCRRWADMVLDEFFAQGDKERELGMPVQFLNDRTKVSRPNSQVGFIEFVIAPLCEVCVQLFPQLDGLADNLGRNICKWNETWQAEANPDQAERDKVNARTQKVSLRCRALLRSKAGMLGAEQSPR